MMNLKDQSLPDLVFLCFSTMKQMMTIVTIPKTMMMMMTAGTMIPMMVAVVSIAVRNYMYLNSSHNLTVPYIPVSAVTTAVVVGETLLYTVVHVCSDMLTARDFSRGDSINTK